MQSQSKLSTQSRKEIDLGGEGGLGNPYRAKVDSVSRKGWRQAQGPRQSQSRVTAQNRTRIGPEGLVSEKN